MKKNNMILIALIIIIIAVVFIIIYSKNENINKQTAKCIGENSLLIASKTCGHCINQKNMFKNYVNLLNITYVDENPNLWNDYNLVGVPTWIINKKPYIGVQSLDRLKKLTGC